MTRSFSRPEFCFALVLVFVVPAMALDPDRSQSQYNYDNWGSDKGVTGDVHAITQTSDGYLWIGTEAGLFRFDGLTFRSVTDQGPSPVSIVHVMGLAVNAQGNLMVRLPERNLLRYSDGKFENALNLLVPRELAVTAMCRGKDGEMLLAGLFHGVLKYSGGRFETIAPVSSLPPSPITSMTQSADGKIWLGTREAGLLYVDGKRVIAVRGELPSREIATLLAAGASVWVGTNAGIVRWNGSSITNEGVPTSLRRTHARAMLMDSQSNLWIGTTSGLLRVNANGVLALDNPRRGSDPAVNALFEDQEGNLWAGGSFGLERWRDTSFITYGRSEGLTSDHNGPIYADGEGRTWFAPLEGGLYWMSIGQRMKVAKASLINDVVYTITGNNGDLWIGRQRGGLTHLRDRGGGEFAENTFTQADGLAQNSVYSVYQSRDGAMWAGTLNGGVSRYQNGKFTTYSAASGLASNMVSSITEGSNGTMWFATPNGLRALANNRWRAYTVKEGLPSDEVNCLLEDSKGILWIGTSAGLAFLTTGGVEKPRAGLEPLSHPVFGIAQDKSGWLWIAASDHIIRVNRDKLLEGLLEQGEIREYAIADGLRSVNGVRRDSSVLADSQGRIWFSTETGLSVVNPAQLTRGLAPSFVHIEAISADNGFLDLHGGVHVPSATRRITFAFSGGSLGDPTSVRFRYELIGYDPDWSAPTATREASYTNIGPGSYRFRVSSSSNRGPWNDAGVSLDFIVAPTYYQTTWFRLSGLAAGLALFAALYQLRSRQVARQFNIRMEERVNERTRIARDLHDTLLQSFQGVVLKLSALKYVIRDRPTEGEEMLDRIVEQSRQAITEGRDAVMGLRSSTVVTNDLAQAINAFGEGLVSDQPGAKSPYFRVVVEGASMDLAPLIRDEVYRIVGEALRNAFRHAHAARIEVKINYEKQRLRVRVEDDGRGINAEFLGAGGRTGHHGLPGMHERAQLAGCKLTIWSEPDSGTKVELNIPASIAYLKTPTPRATASGQRTG